MDLMENDCGRRYNLCATENEIVKQEVSCVCSCVCFREALLLFFVFLLLLHLFLL